jgi:hypothetical protein
MEKTNTPHLKPKDTEDDRGEPVDPSATSGGNGSDGGGCSACCGGIEISVIKQGLHIFPKPEH